MIWNIDSIAVDENETVFVDGRNITQIRKVEKLIGGFVVYKKGRLENWTKINRYLKDPELPPDFVHEELYKIDRQEGVVQ